MRHCSVFTAQKAPDKYWAAENCRRLLLRSLWKGCGLATFQEGCSAPKSRPSWLWPWSVAVMHTWPLFGFVWERIFTLQLALPCSSRWHKENKLQGVEPCPAPCFGQVWDARACCCTACHPAAILGGEYGDWSAWLFTLLCSQEPEKNALQAGGNNSRRIQSLHNTIFQTLSVFESYV